MQLTSTYPSLLLPGVSPEMLYPEFWLARFQNFGLDDDWIGSLKTTPELILRNYFDNIDNQLKNLYHRDGSLPEKIIDNRIRWNFPEYGLITKPGDLKLIPQEMPLFSNKEEPSLDRNQLSGLDIGDQVNIFGLSKDGEWYLLVCNAGTGWVKREIVGIGSKLEVLNFRNEQSRMILIDPNSRIINGKEVIMASMGCSFPLNDYLRRTVLVPESNAKGSLKFNNGIIIDRAVRDHLPKTAYYLIRQAFKYLGYLYAWGDRDSEGYGRDCSRLVKDVLETMGFKPPRNSREQLAVGKKRIKLAGMNISQKLTWLKQLSPGSLLFTPSHVMFFLGKVLEEAYAIHALLSYRNIINNKEEQVKAKRVVVSGLTLGIGTRNGSLLEQIVEVISD